MTLDWRKAVLHQGARISDAVRVLNEEKLRIALVVDDNPLLVGTVTDGDVRRGLIKHTALTDPVVSIMNTNPITATTENNREWVLALMHRLEILQVPILDAEGHVVRVEFLQELTGKQKHDNSVLLMAGGFGKRLHPLTLDTPKPMLKVGRKPILESIIEQLVESGFHNLYVAIHYKGDVVKDYFGDGSGLGAKICYLEEKTPLGTGGALGMLPEDGLKLPILLINGDLLTNVDFSQMLAFHNEQSGDITVCVREYDLQVPYGVVEVKNQKVVGLIEKPVQKFFVNAGIYVIAPRLKADLSKTKQVDMPDILNDQIICGKEVNVFPIHEYWLDIGLMKQYEQAQSDIGRLHDD